MRLLSYLDCHLLIKFKFKLIPIRTPPGWNFLAIRPLIRTRRTTCPMSVLTRSYVTLKQAKLLSHQTNLRLRKQRNQRSFQPLLAYISKFKRDKGAEPGCRKGRRADQVGYKNIDRHFILFLKDNTIYYTQFPF